MLTQVACPACGVGNRLGARKDLAAAKCGACGAPLRLVTPLDVDDALLAAHLKNTAGPVIIDVWAPWCGPCRLMEPNFKAAAAELAGRARLLKLNADTSEAAARLGVRSIPSLILFAGGREQARNLGLRTKDAIVGWARENSAHPAAAQSCEAVL